MSAERDPRWLLIEEERRANRERQAQRERERKRQIEEFRQRARLPAAGGEPEPEPEPDPEPDAVKPEPKPPLVMSNPRTGRVSVEAQLQYRKCRVCLERLPLSWFWPISEQTRNRRLYSRSEVCRDCAIYQDPDIPDESQVIPDIPPGQDGTIHFRSSVRVRLRGVRMGSEARTRTTD